MKGGKMSKPVKIWSDKVKGLVTLSPALLEIAKIQMPDGKVKKFIGNRVERRRLVKGKNKIGERGRRSN